MLQINGLQEPDLTCNPFSRLAFANPVQVEELITLSLTSTT